MRARLLFLAFLVVFFTANVAFQIFGRVYAAKFHVLQGKYIDVKAPLYFSSDFPGKMEAELPLFNRIYEAYYDLTGLQPYDGRKITVFYDPSISEAVAYAGQIIRIGKGFWDEPNGDLIGHELGHCFTLEFDRIFPKQSCAFIEGWAQFIRQYAFWVISTDEFFPWLPANVTYPGLYQQDLYQWFKQYEEEALSTYIQNGCKFEMIQANAWAGILQEIADEYGWNTYKRLFHLLQTDEVQRYSCPIQTEDRCNLFVACLNMAARDDLTTKFMTYGFPIDRDKVHEWEIKISPSVPIPDIKVNNSDGPITLYQNDTLTITVSLNNNGITEDADWWLAADTPFGLFFFTFDGWTGAWVPGYQSPLSYLDSFEVLTMPVSGLRAGTYTLYFGVDTVMDGNVTWDSVYYDIVEVNIIGYSYLLEKYAPVLKFCYLNEERYLPTRVEDMIEHSELRVHIVVPSERPDSTPVLDYWDTLTPVLDQGDFSEGITAKELSENSNITEAYFNLDDDYLLTWSASQCVVYGRVVPSGDYTYLQYWFFYVYNNWENEHESDWEMITVELDKDMIPQRVGYSQHTKVPSIWKGGEVVPWEKVEENGHPVVYVAKGSHASYPTSGSTNVPYPLGDKVFWGIDWHPGNFAIEPSSSFYQLLRIDDEASRYWEWIKIDKLRWGKDSGWGGSPSSPVVQGDKWSDPGAWMDSLQ